MPSSSDSSHIAFASISKNIDLMRTSRNCKTSLKTINTERRVENPNYINMYSTNTHNKIYNTSNLKILHQNARDLNRKTEEFLFSLAEINPQIICVTEHHRSWEEINICDFGQFTLQAKYCRTLFKYGGVAILMHRNLISKEIELNKYCSEKDLEICALKVKLKSTTLLILCFYKSPKGNFSYFLKQIEKLLTELYKPSEKIIMCVEILMSTFWTHFQGPQSWNHFYCPFVWKVQLVLKQGSQVILKH
jgi:hypothetical protein